MDNKAMERKLQTGECIDISACPRTANGWYLLDRFVEDVDYCDAKQEAWVWSVGKFLHDNPLVMADFVEVRDVPAGAYVASLGSELYQSEHFECVFLR